MNDFFVGLRVLLGRLHLVFAIVLLAWEVIGQNTEGADTPIRIVASISNYSTQASLAILIIMILTSYFFWFYILGSFIRKPLLAEEGSFLNDINPINNAIDWIMIIVVGLILFYNLDSFITL